MYKNSLKKNKNYNLKSLHAIIVQAHLLIKKKNATMNMYSGRQGKTLVHAHARLHILEQQHWYPQMHNQRHTEIRQRKNGDVASIQTAPALRSKTA